MEGRSVQCFMTTGMVAYGKGTDVTIKPEKWWFPVMWKILRMETRTHSLSSIDARVFGAGASGMGGNIAITTDILNLTNGGNIRSGLYADAPGNAGDIRDQRRNH